ncbi:MAG: hypothetical protein GY810_23170 [Aureispira sp.]|nr:hypothetical protein [Aureispira sp.]
MKSLIISLSCFFFMVNAVLGQTLQFPKEIVYYELEEEDPEENGGHYTETSTFHPIGWSPDGKFAYVKIFDGYSDGLCISVAVQDMVTDKTVWSESYTSMQLGENEDYAKHSENVKALWNKVKPKTEKALAKYKINAKKELDYRKKTWHRINGQPYKFALTTKGKIQIDCRAKDMGSKTLYEQDISPEDFEMQEYNAYVAGIILSPYEDRVAILYQTSSKGFEFITDQSFALVGCNLNKGFK